MKEDSPRILAINYATDNELHVFGECVRIDDAVPCEFAIGLGAIFKAQNMKVPTYRLTNGLIIHSCEAYFSLVDQIPQNILDLERIEDSLLDLRKQNKESIELELDASLEEATSFVLDFSKETRH